MTTKWTLRVAMLVGSLTSSMAACSGDDAPGAMIGAGGAGPGGASGAAGVAGAPGAGGAGGAGAAGEGGPIGPIPSLTLSGRAVDFQTGQALVQTTVTTAGLYPPPMVSVAGADFRVTGIPPFSVFHLLAGSPPTHRSTYNVASRVDAADVSGTTAEVVSEAFLGELATAFGVTPQPGTGVLIARVVDAAGAAKADVPRTAFLVGGAAPARGPYFLDAQKRAAPMASATTASGYAVFFDLVPGLTSLSAPAAGQVHFAGSDTPTAANTVSLGVWTVTNGAAPAPTNVSLARDILPIFLRRGCESCHSGSNVGRDLGALSLNGGPDRVFRELTVEVSPNYQVPRVNLAQPAASKLLTMPSAESPADRHPNVTFASDTDPDYLLILSWIKEGARNN